HQLVYEDADNVKHRAQFEYEPVMLQPVEEGDARMNGLHLQFNSPGDSAVIRLAIADTSFVSRDINEMDTIRNGAVTIPPVKLQSLRPGPATLVISHEIEQPFDTSHVIRGRIMSAFEIQRTINLQ
ncbi:MAG TPA: hypothetical protein VGC95_09365, partial [Chitinophagaceae bacterium]